jgi:hypothetical protein
MSDSSEPQSSAAIRVLKLVSGEELVATMMDEYDNFYELSYPAKIESHSELNSQGIVEYIKLTNYASNTKTFVIKIPKSSIIFISEVNEDLIKMYMAYIKVMLENPKSVSGSDTNSINAQANAAGLQLLNELFNNEDFVEFVNELIESYEGVEIEDSDSEEDEEIVLEDVEEPAEIKPKKKKKIKPESNKLPYDPDANPNSAEGWSDNPTDYLN